MDEKFTLAWVSRNVEVSERSNTTYAGQFSERASGSSPGVSWETAPDSVKKGLASPPNRSDFSSNESFEDASSVWAHYVLPELSMRVSRLKGPPEPK